MSETNAILDRFIPPWESAYYCQNDKPQNSQRMSSSYVSKIQVYTDKEDDIENHVVCFEIQVRRI